MRSHPKPESANEDSDNVDDRCLLYLLGEMSDEQTAVFETELAKSAELQAQLISQSDVLIGLSNVQPVVTPAVSPYDPVRVLMTIAGIAACALIAFLSWPTKQAHEKVLVDRSSESFTPESLLIAHAWAEGSLTASIADLTDQIEPFADSDPAETFVDSDQTMDDDSSLSWIVAAVEAGAISDG